MQARVDSHLMNAAMQIERQKHLGVGPYERSSERQGEQRLHTQGHAYG